MAFDCKNSSVIRPGCTFSRFHLHDYYREISSFSVKA
jgi:hypothetical protein